MTNARVKRALLVIGAAAALTLAAACQPVKKTPPLQPFSQTFTTPGPATFAIPSGICNVTARAAGGHGGMSAAAVATGGGGQPERIASGGGRRRWWRWWRDRP